MEINLVATDRLASRCAEESLKKHPANRDDNNCFELIRRAFGLDDHFALGFVFDIYKDVWSRFWVRTPNIFDSQALTVDDFKSIAFARVYHQLKGSAFDGFTSFTALLAYFHITLSRTIAQYLRSPSAKVAVVRFENEDAVDALENIPTSEHMPSEVEKNIIRREIEKRVAYLLPDANDQLLFDCWARQNLSRREIVASYSAIWEDEDKVRVANQRIKRRLIKDPVLVELLKDLL